MSMAGGRGGPSASGLTAGGSRKPSVPCSKTTASGGDKFAKAFAKAAADVASNKRPAALMKKTQGAGGAMGGGSGKVAAKKKKDAQYRNLVNPATQQQKREQYLAAFEKLKDMSLQDMQVLSPLSLPPRRIQDMAASMGRPSAFQIHTCCIRPRCKCFPVIPIPFPALKSPLHA